MKTTQTGKFGETTNILLFVALLFIMMTLIYLCLHVEQPYIWIVKYQYKSKYYKPFVLPPGYDIATQGRVWSAWDTDEHGIQDMCKLFNDSAGYINNKKSNASKQGMKLWEEWIVQFLAELEASPIVDPNYQGFPWGNNWYEFTISATTNMAYYIVNKKSSGAIKLYAAKCIQYIIKDPQTSLGYTRDKANSAMMLFPWTLAHMVTGTLDKTNPAYLYGIQQYDLAPNTNIRANEDGVHLDYSYLTHGGVYAYGYLWSIYDIYHDAQQVIPEVKFFDLDYHIDMIYSKLRHPKIDTAGGGLWHRYFKLDGAGFYDGDRKTRKCEVIPSMRYIRYFDDHVHFSARTMQTTAAYYEADHTVDNMGLYTSLCRRLFKVDDDPVPRFPDIGFIYPTGTTELIATPSTNTTTTPFFCELIEFSKSYVWTDGMKYGILFQYRMKLPPLVPEEFTEVLCIYLEEQRIETHYRIQAQGMSVFLGDKEWDRDAGSEFNKADGYVIMETDLKNMTYKSYLGPNSTSNDKYMPALEHFTNGEYREYYNKAPGITSGFFIEKYVNGDWVPFSYIPGEEEVLKDTITAGGVIYTYDIELNQYQYIKP